jgi:phospholipid/cholesterol/gamma-HCH transport system substrate-binding protein
VGIIAVLLVAVLVIGVAVWWFFLRAERTITAYFNTSVGVYSGTEVRVLGLPVGKVTKVTPMGDQVKVEMRITEDIDLPADVGAVQITPALISDRFIQLTPAYSGGPKVEEDNLVLDTSRTKEPVEVDEIYEAITNFTDSLGPTGDNTEGAINEFINTAHENLVGNGEAIGESITALAEASRTLASYRGDFFETLKNLQLFATALAENDAQVRLFNQEMASFTGFIAGERDNLAAAIEQLSFTLDEVAVFVNDNREALASNIDGLAPVTARIAQETDALAEILITAPVVVSNLANSYDAESGTIHIRPNLQQLQNLGDSLCRFLELQKLYPGDPRFEELGRQVAPLAAECRGMIDQINAGIKTPGVTLPFGIMSNTESQLAGPVPGTVPGNPSPAVNDIDRARVPELGGGN